MSFSVRSTSVKRTVLTARGVVAGLFGKENIKGIYLWYLLFFIIYFFILFIHMAQFPPLTWYWLILTKILPKPILKNEINIAFGKLIIRKSKVFIKDLNNFDMEIYNIN